MLQDLKIFQIIKNVWETTFTIDTYSKMYDRACDTRLRVYKFLLFLKILCSRSSAFREIVLVRTYFRFSRCILRSVGIIFSKKIISMPVHPLTCAICESSALMWARLQGASFMRKKREVPSFVRIIRKMQPSWTSFVRSLWLSRLQDWCCLPTLFTLYFTRDILCSSRSVGACNQFVGSNARFHCGAMQLVRGLSALKGFASRLWFHLLRETRQDCNKRSYRFVFRR